MEISLSEDGFKDKPLPGTFAGTDAPWSKYAPVGLSVSKSCGYQVFDKWIDISNAWFLIVWPKHDKRKPYAHEFYSIVSQPGPRGTPRFWLLPAPYWTFWGSPRTGSRNTVAEKAMDLELSLTALKFSLTDPLVCLSCVLHDEITITTILSNFSLMNFHKGLLLLYLRQGEEDAKRNILLRTVDIDLTNRELDIVDTLGFMQAFLKILACTSWQSQLSAIDEEETRNLTNVCIHLERMLELVTRKYSVLHGTLLENTKRKRCKGSNRENSKNRLCLKSVRVYCSI